MSTTHTAVLVGLTAVAALGPGVSARRAAQTAAPPARAYPIRAVPAKEVRITGGFWASRLETNRAVTIPYILDQNENTGRVANFRKAAHREAGPFEGKRYNDSDVYKGMEAAALSLATHPDPVLERRLDELIAIVAAAQEPDGYLYTARTVDPKRMVPGAGPERWSWLHTSHELYVAGHLYEAAVAHYRATGKRTLLDVAIRNADLVCREFGPNARHDVPGHQEIELALVKLFDVTGDRKYLDEARFFLDQRGRQHSSEPHRFADADPFAIYNDRAYRQDHVPVLEQTRATGHAVRATYMFAGMTDIATLFGLDGYARAVRALFDDVTSRRMYVTGGLGSKGVTEAFGDDYDLPNEKAYAETCASVGGMLWYHRMFLREGDATYLDALERTLYNGFLSGVSLDGRTFFYENPLASAGNVARSPYFDVACCPANLARLMAQLPGLVYAHAPGTVYVNLFVDSEASITVDGTPIRLVQRTEYPWEGRVSIRVDAPRPTRFTLAVRVPGWIHDEAGGATPGALYRFASAAHAGYSLDVNGRAPRASIVGGGVHGGAFAELDREWRAGDSVTLELPMPVRRVLANERVADDRGRAAVQRGPIVFCLEGIDHAGALGGVELPLDAPLRFERRADLLGGVGVVVGKGCRAATRENALTELPVTAVPYFAWANRGKAQMEVWIPTGTM